MGRGPDSTPPESPASDAGAEVAFEVALERLEAIVDRLEQGDLTLEEALSAFEQGVGLARRCAGQLDDAERRIDMLVTEGEKWIARPFEESDEPEEAE